MSRIVDFSSLSQRVEDCRLPVSRGRVTAVHELVINAQLPAARIGDRVFISPSPSGPNPSLAEVVSCDGSLVSLLPLEPSPCIGIGDQVVSAACPAAIACGPGLLGRIISPTGESVDEKEPLNVSRDVQNWSVDRPAPNPLTRLRVDEQLVTGIRSIDGCLAMGKGQRIGLFAQPGLGKSTLLGTLARRAKTDVCVVCLVGERGREVREFLDMNLGPEGLARSTVVLAPADAPVLLRAKALQTATAVAEWFRDQGKHVLLLVDSLTRVVRARRDVALALGEAPARGGFPSSSFSTLPGLLERAGRSDKGSITAVYAVLTEGDNDDPVSQEAKSLLDGHIVLSPKLARAGRWPAVDPIGSVSRVMDAVVSSEHLQCARKLQRILGAYEENEDLILMGAYSSGSCPQTDLAIKKKSQIESFLSQGDSSSSIEHTMQMLEDLVNC